MGGGVRLCCVCCAYLQVVLQSEFALCRIRNVTSVRDGSLNNTSRRTDRIDAKLEVIKIVQGVEDTEHIHTVLDSDVAKLEDGVVGVVGVSDAIRAA